MRRLGLRMAWLFAILCLEWIPLSTHGTGRSVGVPFARFLAIFCVLFLVFGYSRGGQVQRLAIARAGPLKIGWIWFAAHLWLLPLFIELSDILGFHHFPPATDAALIAIWHLSGLLAFVLVVLAFIPPALLFELLRPTGNAWAYAVAGGVVASGLAAVLNPQWESGSWQLLIGCTFSLVKLLLGAVHSPIVADPSSATIGTPAFNVKIGGGCSGIDGLGIMLAFSLAWLYFSRQRIRFPHALVLVPAGLLLIYGMNILRIVVLILIGDAGAPGVALGGFHSQAGWIAFSGIALAFAISCERWTWLKTTAPVSSISNPTAIYLTPFLVIVATSLLTHAASAGFEWLYPLRLLAAAIALWLLRSHYRNLNWRIGWAAPVAGTLVFVLWIALDRLTGGSRGGGPMPAELANTPVALRTSWIVARITAAITTVPIAEELAFRGFLMRRMIDADFESVSLRRFTWPALLCSSVAFGLLHGQLWIAGTLAGLVYAWVMLRKGSIGDAAAAHAITNAWLAAYVLFYQHWNLW